MARMWMPGAAFYKSSRDGGSMIGGEPRATDHVMVTPYTWSALQSARYLVSARSESTLVVHPISGQIIQIIPANRAARALMNLPGGLQTNRMGSVNIQTEFVAMPDDFTTDLTSAGKRALAARANWLDTLGINRVVAGNNPPAQSYAQANSPGWRNAWRWKNNNGYFDHSDVVENKHWDTAVKDKGILMAKGSTTQGGIILTPGAVGAEWFAPDDLSVSTIKALQKAVGVKADGVMGPVTAKATQEWLKVAVDGDWGRNTVTALQKRVGATVDGVWGPKTASALRRHLDRDADGGDDIAVDGLMGANTVRAIQKWSGSAVDGIMGRNTIKRIQRKVNVRQDGVLGPNTVKALQRLVSSPADGDWGRNTTKALQRYLNRAL